MTCHRSRTCVSLALALLSLTLGTPVLAFKEPNHEDISSAAFTQSSIQQVLRDLDVDPAKPLIGYQGTWPALAWLRQGARDEDAYVVTKNLIRFRNHFYDPFFRRGLTWGVPLGEPAPDWALEDPTEFFTQAYSYRDARAALFKALTLREPGAREAELARTFEILGHLVHMVQDMAVPAHTRNDIHNIPPMWPTSLYERFLEEELARLNLNGTPVAFDLPRQYWTSEDYQWGSGLADFTSRAFVSEGTNFTTYATGATGKGGYPLPTLRLGAGFENVEDIQAVAPGLRDRQGNLVEGTLTFFANEFNHPVTHAPLRNPRMTTYSVFDRDLIKANRPPVFTLNRFNVLAQADTLVPLAVGYSAGLLDHFFLAGKFDFFVELDEQNPTQLRLLFQNVSGDDMVGTFTLYADDPDGMRSVVVSKVNTTMTVGWNAAIAFPIEALPNGVKRLTVVFQGTHGPETRAVGGKVKPWEMPFILAKQETTEFTAAAVEWEDRTYYPESWARGLKKQPGKQLVKGTFVTLTGAPAGKYVKRVWSDYGNYGSPGVALRLFDKEGQPIDWDPVSSNPNTLTENEPSRWEIEADLTTIYGTGTVYDPTTGQWNPISRVALPRYLVIETLAGTLIKNPLVWWKTLGVSSSTWRGSGYTANCGAPVAPDYYSSCATLVSTVTYGELFFGDGDPRYGQDLAPTGTRYPVNGTQPTAVHFTAVDPVAGHGVGATDSGSIACGPTNTCTVTEGTCSLHSVRIFQSKGSDDQLVWEKDTFNFSDSDRTYKTFHSEFCPLLTPPMPEVPAFPEARLKRDYLPAELNLFTKLGIQQGFDYKITLK